MSVVCDVADQLVFNGGGGGRIGMEDKRRNFVAQNMSSINEDASSLVLHFCPTEIAISTLVQSETSWG
jgi:hypothetical protein